MTEARLAGPARGYSVKLLLLIVLVLQIAACSYRFGDDFYSAPIFCSAAASGSALSLVAASYAIGLLLNPIVMMAGLFSRKMAPFALAFAVVILTGNIGQIWLLDAGKIFCDGP